MAETPPDRVALIVLAAGAGTRMKSSIPKPLHPVGGRPMLWHVLAAGSAVGPAERVVVLSREIAEHPAWAAAGFDVSQRMQTRPLGTADAVKAGMAGLPDVDWLLILFADHPLLTGSTVQALLDAARRERARVTVLTCALEDAAGYARIERDVHGRVTRIVERKDDLNRPASGAIEINSGMMVVDARWARTALPMIEPSPATGEYYLPELVRLAVDAHGDGPWPVQTMQGEPDDLLGVNDRIEQAHADSVLRGRIRRRHMASGVTLVMPETISIDDGATIGEDTTILPFSVIEGDSRIGRGCVIGPHASLRNAALGDGVVVRASTVDDSALGDGSDAGPYAHLRDGARVGERVHIGNYAELKNSDIGEGTRIGHVSYVGDATLGPDVNIGAGTVTCNFDGVTKHRTHIGAGAFVGSDTMLVAPVTVGIAARTGAGSVVTRDVPGGATVVGTPARQVGTGDTERVLRGIERLAEAILATVQPLVEAGQLRPYRSYAESSVKRERLRRADHAIVPTLIEAYMGGTATPAAIESVERHAVECLTCHALFLKTYFRGGVKPFPPLSSIKVLAREVESSGDGQIDLRLTRDSLRDIGSTPLTAFGFSARVRNALGRRGVTTVDGLGAHTPETLLRMRNLPVSGVRDIGLELQAAARQWRAWLAEETNAADSGEPDGETEG